MRPSVELQPISGCSYASPGCTNCKTMKLAGTELRDEFERDGLVKASKAGPVWTGELRFSEARLNEPRKLNEPATVFVNPHGDLFHENAPDAWIDCIFGVMESCQQHHFQVLTKRAARMHGYVRTRWGGDAPPAQIHLGISCERQAEADQRIPLLQQTPAALRYVTIYPLLGEIVLRPFLRAGGLAVVLAGEEAERPADPAWSRSIRAQCAVAGVPFHFSSHLVGTFAE